MNLVAQKAKEYVFTHFTTINGLASNNVNSIVQDNQGFIWFGTANGLQRYDGNSFITFRNSRSQPNSIPSDNVHLLYLDKKKKLWVITDDNKIGTFDRRNHSYREVRIRWKIPMNHFIPKHLLESKEGKLILSTGLSGIYFYDSVTNQFIHDDVLIPAPQAWRINLLQRDTINNKYWLTCDSGLAVYDPVSRNLSYRGHNKENNPVIKEFGYLINNFGFQTDGHGRYHIAVWPSSNPLTWYHFNSRTGTKLSYSLSREILNGRYHEINGHLYQRNGRIWIFGNPFITEFRENEKSFEPISNKYANEQSIRYDNIHVMYEDRQQNIWICSDNGVFLFNPDAQIFNTYGLIRPGEKESREGPVQTVTQLRNGQVWVGCWGMGLFCYDKDLNPIPLPAGLKHVITYYSIWTILEQKSTGYIWIGLQGGGLIIYDPAKKISYSINPPEFESKTIRQLAEDKYGNMWIGSHGGHIGKWEISPEKDVRKGYKVVTKKGMVLKLICDSEGDIWAATAGMGLYRIKGSNNDLIDEFNHTAIEPYRLWRDSPLDILQLDDSLMLVANGALDIVNRHTKRVTHISTDDGLPSNNVVTIQKDNQGLIWLGMKNGLGRYNVQKGIFTTYDRRDGITYDNFLIAGSNRFHDGRLAFNNDRNFLIFDPSKVVKTAVPPTPLVTSIRIGGESHHIDSLLQLSKIILPYYNNSIEFGFSALNFRRQEKIHYHYRMEGVDKDFHEASDGMKAVYNYLPHGDHVFSVGTESADGVPSADIARFFIRVEPPFWRTWWFYGLVILTIIGILYWIDRERVRRMIALQQVRSEIAGNLHTDVNTTLNSISLLSEMAKIKADKDVARAKEYIDQINQKSRNMIVAMDDMLWSIEPGNDTMEKTLDRMREFAESLKKRTGVMIDFMVDDKVKKLEPGMKTRHEMFMIFKQSLDKSIHSGCRHIIISIDYVKSRLQVKIKDDCNGNLNGNMRDKIISDMKRRAETLNAVLDIQSDSKSTSVILQVPVLP